MENTLDWRCFLALEAEFVDTFNTVEFHEDNFTTFSIKYRSLILQACAEIEKLCKNICGIPQDEHSNLGNYRTYLNTHHAEFADIAILIPAYNITETPWTALKVGAAPQFWIAYQAIKHSGDISKATFQNALQSLAGYFALMLGWYVKSTGANFSHHQAFNEPRLFFIQGLKPDQICLDGDNLVVAGFTQTSDTNPSQ